MMWGRMDAEVEYMLRWKGAAHGFRAVALFLYHIPPPELSMVQKTSGQDRTAAYLLAAGSSCRNFKMN